VGRCLVPAAPMVTEAGGAAVAIACRAVGCGSVRIRCRVVASRACGALALELPRPLLRLRLRMRLLLLLRGRQACGGGEVWCGLGGQVRTVRAYTRM
jgi:hypothetical protein